MILNMKRFKTWLRSKNCEGGTRTIPLWVLDISISSISSLSKGVTTCKFVLYITGYDNRFFNVLANIKVFLILYFICLSWFRW